MSELYRGDCLEVMKKIPDGSVDLIVTSPPYDNLRTYNDSLNWNFDIFKNIALELKRVLIKGGVIVWVVGDQTIKGSETGTSFKQALYFKEIGFNLHDTMIYEKLNYAPLSHNRYEQSFEYMFILSLGKPNIFNALKVKCKHKGKIPNGTFYHKSNQNTPTKANSNKSVNDEKIKNNIWSFVCGGKGNGHPAQFPEKLALDHIKSWSKESDTVLDLFMGSGTTGVACKQLNRKFIGIELDEDYFKIAEDRINGELL